MSPYNKKNLLKTVFTANAGCGCGKLKLSDVHEPTPRLKKNFVSHNSIPNPCSSSNSSEKNNGISSSTLVDNEEYSSTTFSFNVDSSTQNSESDQTDPAKPSKIPSPSPKIINSIAVVKDSNDPYQDFRHSMLQMIMEKEIYSKDDLQGLLNCFLELNSPCHHDVIVQAFTEIWNEDISKRLNSQKIFVHVQHSHDESYAA